MPHVVRESRRLGRIWIESPDPRDRIWLFQNQVFCKSSSDPVQP